MAETTQNGISSTGKLTFVVALLGCLAILGAIEIAPTQIFSKAFYIHSHPWEIKLWLASPFLLSAVAGVQVWKDANRKEMKQKTAGFVLSSMGAVLMLIYSLFLEVWFPHSI